MRSIVGWGRNAAKAVFTGFLAKFPALNADQMTWNFPGLRLFNVTLGYRYTNCAVDHENEASLWLIRILLS